MNVFYWNIRGIGNFDSKIALRNLCLSHKPFIIFIAEPMILFDHVTSWYWNSIGVSHFCLNVGGHLQPNLWALWSKDTLSSVLFVSDQCIALQVSCQQSHVYIAAVYASTFYLKRRQLWADLTNLQRRFQGPWLFLGDFNAVLGAHEKRGCRPPPPLSCLDFLNWSNANLLTHLNTLGAFYSWTNGRLGTANVALRLDRAICNADWIHYWRKSSCSALVRHQSDHYPLHLTADFSLATRRSTLKFFKTWSSHADCIRLLVENWAKIFRGHGMSRLQAKLRHMKKIYTHWNSTVFGDVDRQVRLAVDEVNRIQQLIDADGCSDELYSQDIVAQLILTKALNHQEELWREKARDNRFLHGDRHMAYFHRVAKICASKKLYLFTARW